MIIGDMKKIAGTIISKLNPKTGEMVEEHKVDEGMPEEEMDDDKAGLEAAAGDIIDAMEQKDAHALATALYSFFELCEAYPHEEGGEE